MSININGPQRIPQPKNKIEEEKNNESTALELQLEKERQELIELLKTEEGFVNIEDKIKEAYFGNDYDYETEEVNNFISLVENGDKKTEAENILKKLFETRSKLGMISLEKTITEEKILRSDWLGNIMETNNGVLPDRIYNSIKDNLFKKIEEINDVIKIKYSDNHMDQEQKTNNINTYRIFLKILEDKGFDRDIIEQKRKQLDQIE
jgi:hypothetical protein